MSHCRKAQVTIFLTNHCNLRCLYCYDAVKSSKEQLHSKINMDFVKRGVLDFFDLHNSREIRFFANGEPTLEFTLMKQIKDWASELSRNKCKFELQTNGFFPISVAEWISKNLNIVWISCDGPADIQNYNRPTIGGKSSSDIVERNIKFLANSPVVLGCRITITKKNVERQCELVDYFSKLGVKVIMSDPMFVPVGGDYSSNIYIKEAPGLMKYAKKFLIAKKYAEEKGLFYGSILTANFDEETKYACRACLPCPHLTTDGYVSACDMACNGTSSKMSDLIYGKYNADKDKIEYNKKKIKILQSRTSNNMPNCQKCSALKYCAGACLGEALNETGSIFGIKPKVCRTIRYLAKRMPLGKGLYPYLHP